MTRGQHPIIAGSGHINCHPAREAVFTAQLPRPPPLKLTRGHGPRGFPPLTVSRHDRGVARVTRSHAGAHLNLRPSGSIIPNITGITYASHVR